MVFVQTESLRPTFPRVYHSGLIKTLKRVACAPCQTAAVVWIRHVGQAADSADATHTEMWHEVMQ